MFVMFFNSDLINLLMVRVSESRYILCFSTFSIIRSNYILPVLRYIFQVHVFTYINDFHSNITLFMSV